MIGDALFVQGTNGPDAFVLNDNGTTIRVQELLTHFDQSFPDAGIASVLVTSGTGSDQVTVQAMSNRPLTVWLGSDNDTFLIGTGSQYAGSITVHGDDGNDTFQVQDNGGTSGKTYQLGAGTYDASDMPGNVSYDGIEQFQLFDGHAGDTVNVNGIDAGSRDLVVSAGTINVGNGNTAAVAGTLLVQTAGTTSLNIDDSADTSPRDIALSTGVATGIVPGLIDFSGANLTQLSLRGPNQPNTWTVNDTPPSITTTLLGGSQAETFNVARTTGPLIANGGDGTDLVHVGNNLQQINGPLTITTNPLSDLNVVLDDSADAAARSVNISNFNANHDTTIGGIAPATITCGSADIRSLSILTGTGADVMTIFGTSAALMIDSAGGNDTVNIGDGDDPLFNVLYEPIQVDNNGGGLTTLNVHDEGDVGSRDVSMVPSAFTPGHADIFGIAYYNFTYNLDQIGALTINGSAGASTYAISATPNAHPATVNGGSNADAFTVTGTNGALTLRGNNGTDTFTVNANLPGAPVAIDSGAGNDLVNVNTDNAGSASARFVESTAQIGDLHIGAGGAASIAAGGNRLLYVAGALDLNPSGATLDLVDNDLLYQPGGFGNQAPAVQSLINQARNGGAWNGSGISSSAARNNAAHNTTLGVMSGSDYQSLFLGRGTINAPFDGQDVFSPGAAVVKYTYYGDADFNGKVNFDDYVRTDNGFNNHRTGWLNGDFNGNGTVNFDDYVLIDLAFNTQGATL
jgi:hypothetical protein